MSLDLGMFKRHQEGKTVEEIAEMYGRSVRDTAWRVKRLVAARQRLDTVNEMRARGVPDRKIVEELRINSVTFRDRLRRSALRGWPIEPAAGLQVEGYVPPTLEEILRQLPNPHETRTRKSLPRLQRILVLRADGLTSAQIAKELGMSAPAVRNATHRMRIAGVPIPPSAHDHE